MRIPNQSPGQMRRMTGTQWQESAGVNPSQVLIPGGFNLCYISCLLSGVVNPILCWSVCLPILSSTFSIP